MLLLDLHELVKDEARCEEYLRSAGILKTFTKCIGCQSERVSMIRGQRFFCPDCRKEWSRRKGSILSKTRMTYGEFLICLAYFCLEFSAGQVSKQFKINYKTVKFLNRYFRLCISGLFQYEIDRLSRIIKGDASKIGLDFIGEEVHISFEYYNKTDSVVTAKRSRIQNESAFYAYYFNNIIKDGGKGKISELERFWRFASERLYNYKGTDQKYYILFWKEIEFRYNNIEGDIFTKVIEKIVENTEWLDKTLT